jgi:hypothetical protein
MPKRKGKIDVQPETDYSVVAIVSSENDYRLSWLVNKYAGFKLSRAEDIELTNKKGEGLFYPCYCETADEESAFKLVVNKAAGNPPLFKSQPKADYLLVLYNDPHKLKAKQAISELSGKPGLIACFGIDPADFRKEERDQLISF